MRELLWVSILTRPEGRVQRDRFIDGVARYRFNPHPSRRTGATVRRVVNDRDLDVSILTRPEGRVQLQVAYA